MESQAGLRYAHTGRAGRARNERGAGNPIRSVLDVGGADVLSHYIQLNGRRGDIPGDILRNHFHGMLSIRHPDVLTDRRGRRVKDRSAIHVNPDRVI